MLIMKKLKIVVAFVFLCLFTKIGYAENYYVRVQPENCLNCLISITYLKQIKTEIPLILLLPAKYEAKGELFVKEYLRIDIDSVVYSDELFTKFNTFDIEPSFIITDNDNNLRYETKLMDLLKNKNLIYTYIPFVNSESIIASVPDSIIIMTAFLEIKDSICYLVDLDDYIELNMTTKQNKWISNKHLNKFKVFYDYYADTLQYHYVEEDSDFLTSIHKDNVYFNSTFATDSLTQIFTCFPYLEKTEKAIVVSRRMGLLNIENGEYKNLVDIDKLHSNIKGINEINYFFWHEDRLFIPIYKYFPLIGFYLSKYQYITFTKGASDSLIYEGHYKKIKTPFSNRNRVFLSNIYRNNRIFFGISRKYYSFEKDDYLKFDYRFEDGQIVDVICRDNFMKVIYRTDIDNQNYVFFFEEKDNKAVYLNSYKIPIPKIEDRSSSVVFRDWNNIVYLNHSNGLVNLKLQMEYIVK